jgi:hypothetical protein
MTVKHFMNQEHFVAFFTGNFKLDILKVSKTRFASHIILFKRLMYVLEALTSTAIGDG